MRAGIKNRRDEIARRMLHSGEASVWKEALDLADKAIKCGARTKMGTPCQRKGLANGRCIKHGGGVPPHRTEAQKERQRQFVKTQPRDANNRLWVKRSDG